MLRTEYHSGAPSGVSKAIARRRTAEENYAPQTQIVYGTFAFYAASLNPSMFQS